MIAEKLSELLDMDYETVLKKVQEPKSRPVLSGMCSKGSNLMYL